MKLQIKRETIYNLSATKDPKEPKKTEADTCKCDPRPEAPSLWVTCKQAPTAWITC